MFDMPFFESSAKDNNNIEGIFTSITRDILKVIG
jgi:hypothetical protein